jgi:hypothetical protein
MPHPPFPSPAETASDDLHSPSGWGAVSVGDPVRYAGPGDVSVQGIVDDVTEDGSSVWIWADGGLGRRLIHRDDGFSILG